ncbi:hypothetical protein Taro_031231 [Colocasia esculenta]|uniref:Uncharacterized protein n=1 Tax=Colocasia esculenta TaxID=4460 RepID=A0A843VPH9_COLES|nr:hypothetical protein [Colocasia esculenta]
MNFDLALRATTICAEPSLLPVSADPLRWREPGAAPTPVRLPMRGADAGISRSRQDLELRR